MKRVALYDTEGSWRTVSLAGALFSQTTGLDSLTDQTGNEIRAVVSNGTNNAGEIGGAGFVGWTMVDSRGRTVAPNARFDLETRMTILGTQPSNASFVYACVGLCPYASAAALVAGHRYLVQGPNWQPAGAPRGLRATRWTMSSWPGSVGGPTTPAPTTSG